MPKTSLITREFLSELHDRLGHLVREEVHTHAKFWLARDLMKALGYARWPTFVKVIDKATAACQAAGQNADDHFLEIVEIVPNEKQAAADGPGRVVEDYALTRYACYLIAQNANSTKQAVAFAQTYFAVQTRRQEMIESRLADQERLDARRKLSRSEKVLSGLIYEHVENEGGFSRIRTKGDQALFGGVTTRQMKQRLRVPKGRAMADFLPTITIKAKDFANEITNFSIKRDYLHTEAQITREHIKNNRDVRKLLQKRRILPEELPAAEDVKKLERRLHMEEKKLPELAKHLDLPAASQKRIFESIEVPAKRVRKAPAAHS